MSKPTQATRHIAIDTPLGEDVLLLQSLSGHEEISRLYEFDLELLSEDYEINFDDIIGQNVTIRMELPDGGTRFWNGYINRFVQGVSTSPQFAKYRATMVPWMWFLTRTSDCRIFQEKTVPDIVKQIFKDLGFSDIEDRLSGGYRTWNYCVQYRETDFNFVSRLMEQEGIYYYFLHEQGNCTIVLCDSLSKHDFYGDYDEIDFSPDTKSSALQERISEWTVEKLVRSGKFAHTDYNFEKPSASLMNIEEEKKTHSQADYEIYDYPGEYSEKEEGEKYAKVRMEELARSHEICRGRSDSRGICPGYVFTMTKHPRRDQNREYLVVSTSYQAAAEDYETSGGMEEMCACSFTVIPSDVQFRPERVTPRPVIQGSQTAIVTGPSGEEIYTDEHGRVKVQFHWDREGKRDENSSCWIRVSEGWAGATWGTGHVPHVGHEVIINFLEGDPDQPLVTGRVYNANNMPALNLPEEKEKTVVCRDHYGNEIVFDAAEGTMRLHSPTHNTTINLGKSIELFTDSNWINNIVGNLNERIMGQEDRNVTGDRNQTIGGNEKKDLVGKLDVKVGSDILNFFGGIKHDTLIGFKSEMIGGYKNELIKGKVVSGHFGTKFSYGNSRDAEKVPLHVKAVGKLYYKAKGPICEKMATYHANCAGKMSQKASEIEQNCAGDITMKCSINKISATEATVKASKRAIKATKWSVKGSKATMNAKMDINDGTWKVK